MAALLVEVNPYAKTPTGPRFIAAVGVKAFYELLKVIDFGHGDAGAGLVTRNNSGVLAGR